MLQLVATAALSIAAKNEEVSTRDLHADATPPRRMSPRFWLVADGLLSVLLTVLASGATRCCL